MGIVPGTTAGQTLVRQPTTFAETVAGMWAPFAHTFGAEARTDIFGKPQQQQTTPWGEVLPGWPPVQTGTARVSPREETLQRLRYFPGPMKKTDQLNHVIPEDLYRRMSLRRGELLEPAMDELVSRESFQRLPPREQKKRLEALVSALGRRAHREILGRQGLAPEPAAAD